MRKLVVGLGNPGQKYEGTRHNIGFDVVDRLAEAPHRAVYQKKFDGLLAETEVDFHRVLLLKPQTYMNLSGQCVRACQQFYKIEPSDLLIVCDDLSLPLGKIRVRRGGSDGGQKGLRDIINHLGTNEIPRIRLGIGDPGSRDPADFVLTRFKPSERPIVDDTLILALQAVAVWVTQGIETAMNRFNGPSGKTD